MLKTKAEKIIDTQQKSIVQQGLTACRNIRSTLDTIEFALETGSGFPIFLIDLLDQTRGLSLLTAKHVALDDAKYAIVRERNFKKKTR